MIKNKKLIAIIPVRKKSKSIKNKNLIKIGKYSLLKDNFNCEKIKVYR